MAEAKFGYRHKAHTRSKEEQWCSAVLQWSNSQIVRFPGAADLRAESDNVRDEKGRMTKTADYRSLLFLSSCRAETGGVFGVMPPV